MSKQPLIDQLDQAIAGILANPEVMPSPIDAEVAELVHIARELRGLPDTDFKANLKADLERKASTMSTKTAVAHPGFHTITPYLLSEGLEFIDFLKRVFDAEEMFRGEVIPGLLHVEVKIGDSMLMIGVAPGRKAPAGLELYNPNVDEVYKRAIDAGSVELEPVESAHWEPMRLGVLRDPQGNIWSIVTHLGKSYIPEGRNTLSASFMVKDAARLVDFVKQAFGAEEIRRFEWPGGMYASVKIGDSVVGISEAANHEWMKPLTTVINMHVPDCDASYDQALRAGAKSISPVADKPWGIRSGGIEDAWGNQWFIVTNL